MSRLMSPRSKGKPNKVCVAPGHARSLELELESQNDKVLGLEHDLTILRAALDEKDANLQRAVNATREEVQARHDIETEEIRKKHQQDLENILESIQKAQNKTNQNSKVIEQITERNQTLELDKKKSIEMVSDILKLLELDNIGDLQHASEIASMESGAELNEQLAQLKTIMKEMKKRGQILPKVTLPLPPPPQTPQSHEHTPKKIQQKTPQAVSPKISPRPSGKLRISPFKVKMINPQSPMMPHLDIEPEDNIPSMDDIKPILSSNMTNSKVFPLVEIVNKGLSTYFKMDTKTDGETAGLNGLITDKSLKSHSVQEFGAQTQFWHSILTIKDEIWDLSDPSVNSAFAGGLVGHRLGKTVYRTRESSVDALLLFVLKSVDPDATWAEEFLDAGTNSCILRKEGALRNSPWLVLMRKGGRLFIVYVKDVGIFRTPMMMA